MNTMLLFKNINKKVLFFKMVPKTLLNKEIDITDIKQLYLLSKEISKFIKASDLFFLKGNLGSGKTTFVRMILENSGWTKAVNSPTYSLIQLYPLTSYSILHSDLYRTQTVENLDIEEYLETHACFIEWPEILIDWRGENTYLCKFSHTPTQRSIYIECLE